MIRFLGRRPRPSDRLRAALTEAQGFIAEERDVLLRSVTNFDPNSGALDRGSIPAVDRAAVQRFDAILARIDAALRPRR